MTRALAERELRSMPAVDLMVEAEAADIRLTVEGEHLRISGPRAVQAFGRLLLDRKSELMTLLAPPRVRTVGTPLPTDPLASGNADTAGDTLAWDAERASAIVAEVDTLIDTALLGNPVAICPVRRNILANERGIVRRLARDRDPFLARWPQALRRLLRRWAEWDAGRYP